MRSRTLVCLHVKINDSTSFYGFRQPKEVFSTDCGSLVPFRPLKSNIGNLAYVPINSSAAEEKDLRRRNAELGRDVSSSRWSAKF